MGIASRLMTAVSGKLSGESVKQVGTDSGPVGDMRGGSPNPAQNPYVPTQHQGTEVAEVVGDGERCSASTAQAGGEAGPGTIREVDLSKAAGPVIAHIDKVGGVMKAAGVCFDARRANDAGSITHKDHAHLHHADKAVSLAKPVVYQIPQEGPQRSR